MTGYHPPIQRFPSLFPQRHVKMAARAAEVTGASAVTLADQLGVTR
jgi:hypothetical protein